jgi:oligoribonuclease (3'-5' exoribonuclease)
MTGMQVSKFQNYVFGSDVFNSNSGLDVSKDQILEIACVITDKELIVLAEGPDIIIHQSDEVLGSMNDWCITHHGEVQLCIST